MPMPPFQSLADLERLALAALPPMVVGYYASGAEDEATLADNVASWARWRILPRVMVDVSAVDCRTELFGRPLAAPILVAPMAMQRLAHPDGELGMAAGAVGAGLPMVVSTMGTAALEEVARAAAAAAAAAAPAVAAAAAPAAAASATPPPPPPPPPLLFQLYVTRDRAFTAGLVRRAEAAGFAAVVVTVDVPVLGKREADERHGFSLPPGLRLANLEGLADDDGGDRKASAAVGATSTSSSSSSPSSSPGSRLAALFQRNIDASLTWAFVAWLRSVTRLPIWVKGVLAPDDALLALRAGVDGIIVSNHGGRQLDGAPSAADCVRPIASAVRRRIPVFVDGGVRRGSDVLRALALGADGVLVGRPILYGLALGGAGGVTAALDLLTGELRRAMALAGCPTLADARRAVLLGPGEAPTLSSRL